MIYPMIFLSVSQADCRIIKSLEQWVCDYCSMGETNRENCNWQLKWNDDPGPQEDPDECGTPVLCVFYGLLLTIVILTAYTTLKGSLK